MKPDWNRRFAAGLLAILLCLCAFSMPAFASGTDPAPEPLPEIIEEEPTTGGMEPEGVPITPKGNATLVDDFYGDKQLITVTTKAGNYFYILIDRANEDKEGSISLSVCHGPQVAALALRRGDDRSTFQRKASWRTRRPARYRQQRIRLPYDAPPLSCGLSLSRNNKALSACKSIPFPICFYGTTNSP